MPRMYKSTSINVDEELWAQFKTECARSGKTVTDQLGRLICNWLNLHKAGAKKRTPKPSL